MKQQYLSKTTWRKWINVQKLSIKIPYAWMLLFLIGPLIALVSISFSEPAYALPPYEAVLKYVEGTYLSLKFHISNYIFIFKDSMYATVFLRSVYIAFLSTAACLIIGFPFAYAIFRAPPFWRNMLILLVVLPFYTSFLVRVYAWSSILSANGPINSMLMSLGFISQPLQLLYNDAAVVLGIMYCYLPFMVMPIFVALQKMDRTMLEAAYDLGCKPLRGFFTITIPLAKKGIIAGSILVLVPAIGEFVIPELLGGSRTVMIGRTIWTEFFANRDWPLAAALAISMFLLVIVPINYVQRANDYNEDEVSNKNQEADHA